MLIGRSDPAKGIHPDINLGLVDTSNSVSRIHAEITQATGGFYIEDKGSMNGTFINGQKLSPGKPAPLRSGDECRFGELTFRFTGKKFKQVEKKVS